MCILPAGAVLILICGLVSSAAYASPDTSCPPYGTSVGSEGAGVLELLKDISINTKWAELSTQTKMRLQTLADERLAAYRSRWAADSLARKQVILLRCRTPAMTSSERAAGAAKMALMTPKAT